MDDRGLKILLLPINVYIRLEIIKVNLFLSVAKKTLFFSDDKYNAK